MISKKDIKHIANLSRLDLNNKKIKLYQKKIKEILDYVDKIKKADTKDISPFKSIAAQKNIFKNDKPKKRDKKDYKKLVSAAPDSEDNFIKTKPIFKE